MQSPRLTAIAPKYDSTLISKVIVNGRIPSMGPLTVTSANSHAHIAGILCCLRPQMIMWWERAGVFLWAEDLIT